MGGGRNVSHRGRNVSHRGRNVFRGCETSHGGRNVLNWDKSSRRRGRNVLKMGAKRLGGGAKSLWCEMSWSHLTGPGEPPENGEMNEMTLPSRQRIQNSSTGGLRQSRLPLGFWSSPELFNLYKWTEKKIFVSLKLECQSDLRLSKQAALTTGPG